MRYARTAAEVAKIIGIPVERWPGQCYGIASAMLKHELIDDETAELRYGHWLGPVSEKCPVARFRESHAAGTPFQRHGWIEIPVDPYTRACATCAHMEDEHESSFLAPCAHCTCPSFEPEEARIVDPTRWVFEGVEPYVYEGPNDYYDMGGNRYREANERPCPPYRSSADRVCLDIWKHDRDAHRFVLDELLGSAPGITQEMAFWLANLSLSRLGSHAHAIYSGLRDVGLKARVPIDNWRAVMGQD
jgi:hypothetical protein